MTHQALVLESSGFGHLISYDLILWWLEGFLKPVTPNICSFWNMIKTKT